MRITAWKSTTASLTLAAGIVTPLALSAVPAAAATTPAPASPACGAQTEDFALSHAQVIYRGHLVHGTNLGKAVPDGPITVLLQNGRVRVMAAGLPDTAERYRHLTHDGANLLLWHDGSDLLALRATACANGKVIAGSVEVAHIMNDQLTNGSGALVHRLPDLG